MHPIDWSAIAAQRGPISQDQRALSEMQALAGESERRLEEAGYIEMAQRDEQSDIQEAHRRGLTVGQWRDKVDAAIAYAESPEHAQAVWERQGYEYASDGQSTEHGAAAEGDDPPPVAAVREDAVLDEPQAAVDYSGPGGDFDLQSASAFENQYPETKDFADLTGEDRAYLAENYPEQRALGTEDTGSGTPFEAGHADILHGRVDHTAMDDPQVAAEYRAGRQQGREELSHIENEIRRTYQQVAGDRGRLVTLVDLRAALPAKLSREQVDAALSNLRNHSDVILSPRTDQRNAGAETQAAALVTRGIYDHQIWIDRAQNPQLVAENLHSRDEDQAASVVASLSDATARQVAVELGVPAGGDAQQVRADLVATSVANHQAWLTDARQGAADGTLLYRADTEPQWAASLTGADRQELAAAAARLQHRAATEPAWAYIKDRADRWADPGADNPTSAQTPERDRQRETSELTVIQDPAGDRDRQAAQHQAETLEYAVGDDLVIGGVVYDHEVWQADGEGGVEPRLNAEDELARQQHRAQADADRDQLWEADWADRRSDAETEDADPAPSVGPELRAARTYLQQRTDRDTAPRQPAEHDTAAMQEQEHRQSARVMAERQQAEPERGIER